MNPFFSIIGPAKRDYAYKRFYHSISDGNDIAFEVIFVGPNQPKEKIGDNFYYIKTDVKPAQCVEIAARIAKGEYLLQCADDETFNPGFLNNLFLWCNTLDKDKILVGSRFYLPEHKLMCDNGMVFDDKNINSSILSLSPALRKDIWHKIGGIDRRFNGCWADLDMQLRFYEYGMNPFVAPDCIISEETYWHLESKKCVLSQRSLGDRSFLRSLWVEDKFLSKTVDKRGNVYNSGMVKEGVMSKKRLSPVLSFDDYGILEKDQN